MDGAYPEIGVIFLSLVDITDGALSRTDARTKTIVEARSRCDCDQYQISLLSRQHGTHHLLEMHKAEDRIINLDRFSDVSHDNHWISLLQQRLGEGELEKRGLIWFPY